MGLDNAICVKRNKYTEGIPELVAHFEDEWDKKHEYDFEIVYYRKCWNVRSMIMSTIFHARNGSYSDNMTKEEVEKIIKGLQSFSSENWYEDGGSIWDWDNEEYPYSEKIQRDIENLKILRELMDKYDLEVYFYDSY